MTDKKTDKSLEDMIKNRPYAASLIQTILLQDIAAMEEEKKGNVETSRSTTPDVITDEFTVSSTNPYYREFTKNPNPLKDGYIFSVDGTILVSINNGPKATITSTQSYPLRAEAKMLVQIVRVTTTSTSPVSVRLNASTWTDEEIRQMGF